MITLNSHERAALNVCEQQIPAPTRKADTVAIAEAISEGDTLRLADLFGTALGRFGQPYPLLLVSKVIDASERYYRHCNLPAEQFAGALADIRRWMDTFSSYSDGAVGLPHPSWIARILTARIYHVGALQVEERAFTLPYRLYRNESGTIVAFAEANLGLDSEGYLSSETDARATTTYSEDTEHITAHRLDTQSGRVSLTAKRYPRTPLELIAKRGTPMLYTHIPARTDLRPEAVDASFREARKVFGKSAQFFTVTWLVDPSLVHVTDPNSRIRTFMERFCKFSLAIDEIQLYEKVFAPDYTEKMVKNAAATTSLQQRVQDALKAGVRFRTTGGYLAPSL